MRSMMKSVAAVLVCLGLSASLGVAIPVVAMAQQTANWNGTWIGNWSGGNGTQIVFADNELIAMYWGGDYLSDTQSSLSPDGKFVTITWQSGRAVLTRDAEASGHIVVHETGRPDLTFDVKRDNQ
jgi:hypothetical protein